MGDLLDVPTHGGGSYGHGGGDLLRSRMGDLLDLLKKVGDLLFDLNGKSSAPAVDRRKKDYQAESEKNKLAHHC